MADQNGHKPRMDVNLLTPNDYRRLRAALPDGQELDKLLSMTATPEDTIQALILGFKLRDDPSFTWDRAGDIPPVEVFDMSPAEVEPDPQTGPAGSNGPAAAATTAARSKAKPRGRANEPN